MRIFETSLLPGLLLAGVLFAQRVEWDGWNTLELAAHPGSDPVAVLSWQPGTDTLRVGITSVPNAAGQVQLADALDLRRQHLLQLNDGRRLPIIPDAILDAYVDYEAMGLSRDGDTGRFRLFHPRAHSVNLHLFAAADDAGPSRSLQATRIHTGSWEVEADLADVAAWTWSVEGPHGVSGWATHEHQFADPWSTAVASRNTYIHEARSLVLDDSHDWRTAEWRPPAFRDLIIYEAHLRDMSAGQGAGVTQDAGSYPAFLQAETGGLAHLRDLGVTAVEFLPLQDFGNIEIDYDRPDLGIHNTWNPYARNHWGYMTSYFLAPESWYASGQTHDPAGWSGVDGRQVAEFKRLVDACHEAGIAVIMDVVYNHVSQYDNNPLKALDPAYWFRLDDQGNYAGASGCGNDLRTERPMTRRLILDSIRHFVEEYRIDGFRFDLGSMIDSETLGAVRSYCHARGVFLTAEPWGGGGYDPPRFAELGWAWWNDVYRVDLRGRHPSEGAGFLFGRQHPESSALRMSLGLHGNAVLPGAINRDPLQSVNYVAAHDDHCLGDWVRIALGLAAEDTIVEDPLTYQTLSEDELRIHGLAALHLLGSGGIPMIHSGQELGRGKVIARGNPYEERAGQIDHNSYEKDNATNWIDWRLLERNGALVDLYRDAIAFRKAHPELADATRTTHAEEAWLSWTADREGLIGLFHSSPAGTRSEVLPWKCRVAVSSGDVSMNASGRRIELGPRSAVLLIRD